VLLELSLKARLTHGVLSLPRAWTTAKAVHDLIGGNRKEIVRALAEFTKPDSDGLAPIQIDRDLAKHELILQKWNDWAGSKVAPTSTERVKRHRENKRLANGETFHALHGETDETLYRQTGQTNKRESAPARAHATQDPSPEAARAELADLNGAGHEPESGYEFAKRLWCELWQKKYRREYEFGPDTGKNSDDRILQRVGNKALERTDAEPYLRHKFVAYLKDHGDRNWLDERSHPLRTLERDWVSYGEPKATPLPVAPSPRPKAPDATRPARTPVKLEPVSEPAPPPKRDSTPEELADKARDAKARLAAWGNGKA
jgi:hypothetical protein